MSLFKRFFTRPAPLLASTSSERVWAWFFGLLSAVLLGLLIRERQNPSRMVAAQVEEQDEAPKPPPLRPSSPEIREAVRGAIDSQIAALRRNDFSGAFKFATEGIREQFTLVAFEKMVRNKYAALVNSKEAFFDEVEDNGSQAIVEISVTAPGQATKRFRYMMRREGTSWRVEGVIEVGTGMQAA